MSTLFNFQSWHIRVQVFKALRFQPVLAETLLPHFVLVKVNHLVLILIAFHRLPNTKREVETA
ncbi:hypothetical protein A1QS_03705 [Vibrio ordalii FS-238]|uniref:Uncharacterized protein n=1 Tax=Vibrio ordalii FS-238 TaxID=617133 RepID=A0A853R660_9VIBR|nr:hypothetical protein A1QS_03705 [Vibrio ordalii FS-238]OXX66816.1 hypothetical protein B9J94_12215 [Vibrio sp. V20_P4S3T152]